MKKSLFFIIQFLILSFDFILNSSDGDKSTLYLHNFIDENEKSETLFEGRRLNSCKLNKSANDFIESLEKDQDFQLEFLSLFNNDNIRTFDISCLVIEDEVSIINIRKVDLWNKLSLRQQIKFSEIILKLLTLDNHEYFYEILNLNDELRKRSLEEFFMNYCSCRHSKEVKHSVYDLNFENFAERVFEIQCPLQILIFYVKFGFGNVDEIYPYLEYYALYRREQMQEALKTCSNPDELSLRDIKLFNQMFDGRKFESEGLMDLTDALRISVRKLATIWGNVLESVQSNIIHFCHMEEYPSYYEPMTDELADKFSKSFVFHKKDVLNEDITYAAFIINCFASIESINSTYRKLSIKWHPDKINSLKSQEKLKLAEEAFGQLLRINRPKYSIGFEQKNSIDEYFKLITSAAQKFK